jgi:hypothetical protein
MPDHDGFAILRPLCPILDTIGAGAGAGAGTRSYPGPGEAGSISGPLRDRNYRAGMTQLWFRSPGFGLSELIAIDRPAG